MSLQNKSFVSFPLVWNVKIDNELLSMTIILAVGIECIISVLSSHWMHWSRYCFPPWLNFKFYQMFNCWILPKNWRKKVKRNSKPRIERKILNCPSKLVSTSNASNSKRFTGLAKSHKTPLNSKMWIWCHNFDPI